MTATFAGADTVGTALTSESPAATIAPITIDRIASSLRPTMRTLAAPRDLINCFWLADRAARIALSRSRLFKL